MLKLVKANFEDCPLIHNMQKKAFLEHLKTYQDFETNPGNEPLKKIETRFHQDMTTYYLIKDDNLVVGAVRVVEDHEKQTNRISPIFILPEHQGKHLAKESMFKLEMMHPTYDHWQLSTILEEKKLCQFYENLGYVRGKTIRIKDNMHLVYYDKKRVVVE